MQFSKRLILFIIPFAILSSLSVTNLLATPLRYLEISIRGSGIFLPTTILPGLIFGIGISIYLKKNGFAFSAPKFIIFSTLIYFCAYVLSFFITLFSFGILSGFEGIFVAIFVGTFLFLSLVNKIIPISQKERIILTIILTIILGSASFLIAPKIDYQLGYTLGYSFESYINPLSGRIQTNSEVPTLLFGMVLPGTQILIFLWQIFIAWRLGIVVQKDVLESAENKLIGDIAQNN